MCFGNASSGPVAIELLDAKLVEGRVLVLTWCTTWELSHLWKLSIELSTSISDAVGSIYAIIIFWLFVLSSSTSSCKFYISNFSFRIFWLSRAMVLSRLSIFSLFFVNCSSIYLIIVLSTPITGVLNESLMLICWIVFIGVSTCLAIWST